MWQCCDFVRSRLTDWLTDWLANWLTSIISLYWSSSSCQAWESASYFSSKSSSSYNTKNTEGIFETETLNNNCTHKALYKTGSVKHAGTRVLTWWIFVGQHTCIFLSLLSISFFPGDLLVVSMTLISCKVIAGNFGNTKFIYLLSQGKK